MHTYVKAKDTEFGSIQFNQLCPTLCNPMDYSTPGFPVHHQFPEPTETHVLLSSWCHPTVSSSAVPFSSCLQSFPAQGSFQMSQFFEAGSQSIRVSASASVLAMNIQDWSPLGLTGLISLRSKDSQESSQIPQFKSINYLVFSFLYSPTLRSNHDYWKI